MERMAGVAEAAAEVVASVAAVVSFSASAASLDAVLTLAALLAKPPARTAAAFLASMSVTSRGAPRPRVMSFPLTRFLKM